MGEKHRRVSVHFVVRGEVELVLARRAWSFSVRSSTVLGGGVRRLRRLLARDEALRDLGAVLVLRADLGELTPEFAALKRQEYVSDRFEVVPI